MSQSRRGVRLPATSAVVVAIVVLLAACANSPSGVPAGGGAGSPVSTSASAGAPATITRTFTPFDRSGAPAAGLIAHRAGSCFTSSITVPAGNAYRCFAGNALLDPCFVLPHNRHLVDCYIDPWSGVTRVRVGSLPAPANPVLHVTRPWAIVLAGGVRCVATNGTPTIVRGLALTYECSDGWAGLRTASGRTVTALYRASDGVLRTVAVTTMWRTSGR